MARAMRRGAAAGPRLFRDEELQLRPTGLARLRTLAARPERRATDRERAADENRATIRKLRGWGADLAGRFELRFKAIDAERDDVTEHYGICYADGLIRIRLRHATTGRLLKESSLVDTLCHELAHLRHFDHSPRFRRFYRRILDMARELGYYRPGPATEAEERPRQARLFADGSCGTVPPRGRRGRSVATPRS